MFDRFSQDGPASLIPEPDLDREEYLALRYDEMEPDCACSYLDVDLVDASGCELHNPESPYRRHMRDVERSRPEPDYIEISEEAA